jgi:glutamine synthetase
MIIPAAIKHLTDLAEALVACEAAEVDEGPAREHVESFSDGLNKLRACVGKLERAIEHESGAGVLQHARHIRDKVRPVMFEVRAAADAIEAVMPRNLWPLPTYREMLSIR